VKTIVGKYAGRDSVATRLSPLVQSRSLLIQDIIFKHVYLFCARRDACWWCICFASLPSRASESKREGLRKISLGPVAYRLSILPTGLTPHNETRWPSPFLSSHAIIVPNPQAASAFEAASSHIGKTQLES